MCAKYCVQITTAKSYRYAYWVARSMCAKYCVPGVGFATASDWFRITYIS